MPSERKLRALIVDDEVLAQQRLEDLLADREEVEIIGMMDNGLDAIEAIRSLRPDLVFLDVQMPGLTGIDVVREIGPDEMPTTIFVTAYDDYALRAFDVSALDYLLKPFDDDRFEQAFARARRVINLQKVGELKDQLLALLQENEKPAPTRNSRSEASPYLERIAVEMRGQIRVVPVEQIDYIESSGPYVELHVGENVFLVRERMQTLEERLDPDRFFRIHRSAIVRLDLVEALLHGAGGDYSVRLVTGKRLKVSRSRRDELAARLGLGDV